MQFKSILACYFLFLTSCSNTQPVMAFLQDDLYYGKATGFMDGSGKINVQSVKNENLNCLGDFRYIGMSWAGKGTLTCNDGQVARFQFQAVTGSSGYGYGKSDKGPVNFTFGMTVDEAKKYLKAPVGKKIRQIDNDKIILEDE